MIEDFSSGYYRTSLNVQEYDDGPVIEQRLYDFINKRLYMGSDMPVTMRLGFDGGPHFVVDSEAAVPQDILALPPEMITEIGKSSVFVLKAEYADQVGEYNG